jgi:hypothetical protein
MEISLLTGEPSGNRSRCNIGGRERRERERQRDRESRRAENQRCWQLAERRVGEQRCRQSGSRPSVERVQFPIGPRGRKKKGRWRGAEEEENGRRREGRRHGDWRVARLKEKPKGRRRGDLLT